MRSSSPALSEGYDPQNQLKISSDSIYKKVSQEFLGNQQKPNDKVLSVYEAFELMHKIDGTSDGRRKFDAKL